jgi:hypothetical protein
LQPQELDWILARHQINHNAYLHMSYSGVGQVMIWLPPQGNFYCLDTGLHFIAVLTVCLDGRRYSVDKGHRNIQNKEPRCWKRFGGTLWEELVAYGACEYPYCVEFGPFWDIARFIRILGRTEQDATTEWDSSRDWFVGGHLMLYLAISLQRNAWCSIKTRGA